MWYGGQGSEMGIPHLSPHTGSLSSVLNCSITGLEVSLIATFKRFTDCIRMANPGIQWICFENVLNNLFVTLASLFIKFLHCNEQRLMAISQMIRLQKLLLPPG